MVVGSDMRIDARPVHRYICRRAVQAADTFLWTGATRGVRAGQGPPMAASGSESPVGVERASSGRHEQVRLGKIFLAPNCSNVT